VAARLDRHTTLAAKRAIVGFVAVDFQLDEGIGLHGKLDGPPTAVDQGACGDYASAGFLDDVDGFFGGAAGGPDVFDDQDVLIGLQREAAAKSHGAAAIALGEESRNAAAEGVFGIRKGASDFLPDDDAAKRWGDYRVDTRIRKQSGESLAELLGETGILQDQGALHISVAVASAREFEVPAADGAGEFEGVQELFTCRHHIVLRQHPTGRLRRPPLRRALTKFLCHDT
jgi:hypothetical protein